MSGPCLLTRPGCGLCEEFHSAWRAAFPGVDLPRLNVDRDPVLRQRFGYIFSDYRPPPGTTKPELRLRRFDALDEVRVGTFTFRALPVQHGPMTVFGFRVGDLGYITDAKTLGPGTREALEGFRGWVAVL